MKRGAPDHWKMKHLARLCNVPEQYALPWANGVMERLWHYTAKYCLQGNIGKVPNSEIAEICCWPAKRADQFVGALLESGWLDKSEIHRLLIHDWPEHADDSVKKTLKNRGLSFIFPENSRNDPEFSGLPSLAFPSLSKPTTQEESKTVEALVSQPANGHAQNGTWKSDAQFARFATDYLQIAQHFIDDDFEKAYDVWEKLPLPDRIERVKSLQLHEAEYKAEPRFVPYPTNFLKREWKRPLKPIPTRKTKESVTSSGKRLYEERQHAKRN